MATDPSNTGGPPIHPMPFCRLELAVLGLLDGRLQVLVAKREGPPHPGRWALPGGVLRIDQDATLEDGARRVMHERLALALPELAQVATVGGKTRDPRAPWALSVVYRGVTGPEQTDAQPGKRVSEIRWRPVDEIEAEGDLAFDHGALVRQAVQGLRDEVEALRIPAGLLPETFTLSELQQACEQVLGRPLDKSSFRRKLAEAPRPVVEVVEGEMRRGAFRPAQLHRLAG
jgi:ADP-ribose pyrophosphatase YjhB (NUDIX family)